MSPSLLRIRWRLIWVSILALSISFAAFYVGQFVYAWSDDQCFWRLDQKVSIVDGREVVRPAVIIQEIIPDGVAEDAGLLEGDELLSIDGKRLFPTRENISQAQRYINDQGKSRVVFYMVRRRIGDEDRIMGMPVMLVQPVDRTMIIMLVMGAVAWAIGLLVVVSTPQRKIARHFFYLGTLTLLVSLTLQRTFGNLPLPLEIIRDVMRCLVRAVAPALLIHFFLRFPHPFALRTNRRFLSILYGGLLTLGGVALVHVMLQRLNVPGGVALSESLDGLPLSRLQGYLMATASVVSLGLFWAGSFRLPRRKRRGLLPALVISSAVLIDLLAYVYLNHAYAGVSQRFMRERWVFFAPLVFLPIAFGYAIFRHGFFDVRRAILRWISYFVVVGITLVAYLGGLAWLFAQGVQALSPGWAGVLLGLSALPVGWLLRTLLLTLRRKFRRDLQSARDLILGNLRETRKRFSEEAILDGLAESLREAFRPQLLLVLPVEDRRMLLPAVRDRDPEDPFIASLAGPQALRLPQSLVRHARDNRELVLGLGSDEADWVREQGHAVRIHIDALEAQVLMLILVSDEPYAAVLLGGKYAELNYGREDRELLREVAMAASIVLETAVLHRRLLDQGRLEQELQTARRIQETLVTSDPPHVRGFQLALRLDPALETGGDLLWVKSRGNRWIAAVGDVSGKGLAAALYMAQATALLKYATQQEHFCLEEMIPALDTTLRNLMGAREFLTLSIVEWEENGQYRIMRAGHPPPLLVSAGLPHTVVEIPIPGRGLGLRPRGPSNWEVRTGTLQPGEWLVMYSDGLTEAMDRHGEIFGLDRLRQQLTRMRGTGSVRAACEAVYREVTAFEATNRDDRTLFILGRDS